MLAGYSQHKPTDPRPNYLMSPPPPRVLVWVDIRSPVIQPAQSSVDKGACLGADDLGNLVYQIIIKGRRHGDGIRKRRRRRKGTPTAVESNARRGRHAMKSFAPPCVRRETDALRAVAHAVFHVRANPTSREHLTGSYSTRFTSFSVIFIAFTSAAARSGGVAFTLHTVLFDNGPLVQSGN